ncbi:50S ribosomal protein L30e-like protein [Blyttiomyces helicus]|uniref:H/ACA ribonucleoprotein complex subunit 2 n=1 Tax=Blyttiomyces helicus TaxID=388810 RepID=A0A4P9WE73_9FUNG|nr:50S ribosomal protein L30e-like protein [Blyttiomyces helicus]|eukprot:RKO90682.1 50S ribosomal protein L30e-like protein [Blyttiomyces helicus]
MAKEKKDKTPKVEKAEKEAAGEEDSATSYEARCKNINEVSQPLASKKLTKKVLKTVKKAAKAKHVKRGVKEVVKGLRKGSKGVVILAGDISPIDVITHVPILCEEANVPYIYVPSKEDLGTAGATKRPTSCIMICGTKGADYSDAYDEVMGEVKELNEKLITLQ